MVGLRASTLGINGITKHDWKEAFFFALAVAVGLTPEMLPMIVSVCLSRGAIAMSRKKVIVKRLSKKPAATNFGLVRQYTLTMKNFLSLTRNPSPGKPAEIDSNGRVLSAAMISCTLPEIFSQVRKGDRIWFDDGKIGGIVRNARHDAIRIEIMQAGPKGTRLLADKGINLPDTDIKLAALTARDLEDLKFIVRHADSVGMSFVRHKQDVQELQRHLHKLNGIVLALS